MLVHISCCMNWIKKSQYFITNYCKNSDDENIRGNMKIVKNSQIDSTKRTDDDDENFHIKSQ